MEENTLALDAEVDGKEEQEHSEPNQLRSLTKKKSKPSNLRRKKKLRDNFIVLNVIDTKYEIIRHVGENVLGWKLCKEIFTSKNWDVYWTDSTIKTEFLAKLEKYQKVNHFPGTPS